MSIEDISFTNDEVFANYDKLDCSVLTANCKRLACEFEEKPDFMRALLTGNPEKAIETLNHLYAPDATFLDIYKPLTKEMGHTFGFSKSKIKDVLPFLESLAVFYIGAVTAPAIRPMMSDLHSGFVELIGKLKKITDEIHGNLDNFQLLMNVFTFEVDQTENYRSAFEGLLLESEKLETLPDFFKNSVMAKIVEFDKAARSTNWALQFWTENMLLLWVGLLDREIKNLNDGKNGRKHLLDFIEFCMRPIHEAVEFETLDNMLRKVQKDVKKRAELSPSNFKVGGSSPFRAVWSKSES